MVFTDERGLLPSMWNMLPKMTHVSSLSDHKVNCLLIFLGWGKEQAQAVKGRMRRKKKLRVI